MLVDSQLFKETDFCLLLLHVPLPNKGIRRVRLCDAIRTWVSYVLCSWLTFGDVTKWRCTQPGVRRERHKDSLWCYLVCTIDDAPQLEITAPVAKISRRKN